MNYRHAFHAGNFADVLKHAVLARILAHLTLKETPFRLLDTHAGLGLYDLDSDEARRTGEWRDGVGRLEAPFAPEIEAVLAPYRGVLAAVRARHGPDAYPGSPLLAREMLRPQDRALFVELHPEDRAVLGRLMETMANGKVLGLDGWTALNANVPPPERRGLVLIDPPYEEQGELDRLAAALLRAARKWPTGVYLAWYPIKDPAAVERALSPLSALARPALRLELMVDRPDDPERLNGCGLVVVNPPYRLADEAGLLLPALAKRLARGGYGAYRCEEISSPSQGPAPETIKLMPSDP
jgi:23S rRNA (adenine2030-N6)-methyltransferase